MANGSNILMPNTINLTALERPRRRHSTGFGYIGFGNNQSVFNRKSKLPFSEIKERLHKETRLHYEIDFLHHQLTEDERKFIKSKIRRQRLRVRQQSIAVSIILAFIIAWIIFYLVTQIMSR
jgi:hypothetical protein